MRLNDISKLEQQLLSQLKEVETKKKQLTQIFDLAKSFKGPLNIDNIDKEERIKLINSILHTKILPYIEYDDEQNISLKWDWNMISSLMAEEVDNVYSFPLLDPKFCDLLLNHIDQYMKFMQNINKTNDNNNEGTQYLLDARRAVLDWMNLSWLNDFLLNIIVNPIVKYLFQKELFYNCVNNDKDKDKMNLLKIRVY